MNEIAWLEFESVYYDVIVQHVNDDVMVSTLLLYRWIDNSGEGVINTRHTLAQMPGAVECTDYFSTDG